MFQILKLLARVNSTISNLEWYCSQIVKFLLFFLLYSLSSPNLLFTKSIIFIVLYWDEF